MQLDFYWDPAGDPRADCDPSCRPLADFLESDVQGSTVTAREILRALDRVEAGDLDDWEATGNVHTLSLSPEGAWLQNEQDDEAEPFKVSLARLRRALVDWVAFLEGGWGSATGEPAGREG